jgi:hypothetical protein
MSLDAIRAQLARLKIHAVNLGVTPGQESSVSLQGSLLQYWKLPHTLDGAWLYTQLAAIPDAAGPEAVMNALLAAHAQEPVAPLVGQSTTQLHLFESASPPEPAAIAGTAAIPSSNKIAIKHDGATS